MQLDERIGLLPETQTGSTDRTDSVKVAVGAVLEPTVTQEARNLWERAEPNSLDDLRENIDQATVGGVRIEGLRRDREIAFRRGKPETRLGVDDLRQILAHDSRVEPKLNVMAGENGIDVDTLV